MLLRGVLLLLACAGGSARQVATMAPPAVDKGASDTGELQKSSGPPLGLAAAIVGAGGAVAAAATPAVRRAINSKLRELLGREDDLTRPPTERTAPTAARADPLDADTSSASEAGSAASSAGSAEAPGGEEPLVLSPERLSMLAQLSPQLEPLVEQLERIPAFTVTVGNTSAPLTVKAPDGSRLAYFFLEYVDAELFRRRLLEQPQMQQDNVEMQVAALGLADVVRAYSQPSAKEQNEHFVLIPTMAAVSSARKLLADRGQEEAAASSLSVANGLVPVFWVQPLAMKTSEGKQRKILFFRESDCVAMWKNVSGSAVNETAEFEEPEMMFSSLQSVAAHLTATNKTDDVVFFPSNTALRLFEAGAQAQAQEAQAAANGEAPPQPEQQGASSMLGDLGGADDDDDLDV
jgi:hypothetical protein|tara:strand:- start:3183 stop:4400 length:1218 start_codon:yes stop_codon:yes gene_type:complete